MQYAKEVVEKVWRTGNKLGYSDYFQYIQSGGITDDHTFVNEFGNFPCMDLVHYDMNGFPPYHHTIYDTLDNIDRSTLAAVGNTLLHVIFHEAKGEVVN